MNSIASKMIDDLLVHPDNGDWSRSQAGLFVPEHLARSRFRPIGIDLFCGCGGFSLGFIEAGFEVVAALDNDAPSAMTYMYNLGHYPVEIHYGEPADKERLNKEAEKSLRQFKPDEVRFANAYGGGFYVGGGWRSYNQDKPGVKHFFFGDVHKFSAQQILDTIGLKRGEVDCVFGGPPCQGFSTSGKRKIEDPRNSLVFEFARMVCAINPRTFVMENVPGILSMITPDGVPVMDALCLEFERGEYGTREAIKQALCTSAGAGMAVKGKTRGENEREKQGLAKNNEAESGAKPRQPALLEVA